MAYAIFTMLLMPHISQPLVCTPNGPAYNPVPQGITTTSLGAWRQWDACWYEQIARVGYQPGNPSVAYFPLYPALMRLFAPLYAGDYLGAGLFVSAAGMVAAVLGLYMLISRDFTSAIARRTVLFVLVFPSAFYLCMPYTEALFLALAIWTILAARRSAWGWAALFAICTSLTRTQGCLLALPLAWEFIRQWRSLTGPPIRRRAVVLVPLLPVTGLVLFIACSKAITVWTTFDAQAATWRASYNLPWVILWHSWQHIRATGSLVEVLNLTLLLLFVGLFVIGVQRLPLSYSLYVAPQLALLTVRQTTFSPLGSVNRYLLVMFPIFVTLALLCSQRRHQFLWLSSSLALLATLFYLFLLGAFIA